VITGLVLGDWGGGRQPSLQLGGQPHLPGQPPINSSTYVREGAGHRQEKADPLRHYRVVESGGGGRSHAGASDSSLCATMIERTGGVLWVTRRKWTDWGQAVSNQSEISLIERGLGREGYWARPNALLSFYVQCCFFQVLQLPG